MRLFLYLSFLERAGIDYKVSSLISDSELNNFYLYGTRNLFQFIRLYFKRFMLFFTLRSYDLIWIEKECFPWLPYFFEKLFLQKKKYVLDFDDAIFHGYDLNKSKLIRRILGDKIDRLMQNSNLVIAGNAYLAKRAKESLATSVQVLPTVIDLNKYYSKDYSTDNGSIPSLVWIGSPSTIHYLVTLENSLRELSLNFKFKLVVIGASLSLPGVLVEEVTWSEESENNNIMKCDIGIMPLVDSPWERGKCGYKIIQYMASGLPVVASNIGANSTIIDNGRSGFLVDTTEEWVSVLSHLLVAPTLREQMGVAGRKIVEDRFCVQRTGPKLVELLITSLE